jgi:hypothetical protein
MEIGNNIKVLLTKYNEYVTVDDIGGELIIYDNTNQLDITDSMYSNLLKDFVFSGIAISGYSDHVKVKLEDFYGEEVKYLLHKNYIYVIKTPTMDLQDPIAVVKFVPKNKKWPCEQFYAHFLKTI